MNYLAHLVLSPGPPLFVAGALAGDFVHGRLGDHIPPALRRGIELHRAVDAFADSHEVFGRSRRRLSRFRHHARIIVDVFYDYYLARDFERQTGESLRAFADRTYLHLAQAVASGSVPPAVERTIANMSRYDSLMAHGERESVRRTLAYLATRMKRRVDMAAALEELVSLDDAFRADFEEFWPQATTFAAGFGAA